jgi:hypothetical protein
MKKRVSQVILPLSYGPGRAGESNPTLQHEASYFSR